MEIESMISSDRSGLEIAKHSIDPVKTGHAGALALGSDDFRLMATTSLGDSAKAGQSIGDYGSRSSQMAFSPCLDLGQTEALNPREDRVERMPVRIGFDGGD